MWMAGPKTELHPQKRPILRTEAEKSRGHPQKHPILWTDRAENSKTE
jgi:hypothetical protein